jgi:elongation of very long chain fatty acids protein 4
MSNSTHIPWIEFFKQDNWYYDLFIKFGDPRTRGSFLLGTPEPMLIIVLAYLAFVFIAPRLMERRPALDLKNLLIVYNFTLVAVSGYMCVEFFLTATLMGYSYTCAPIDWTYSTDSLNMRLISVSWLFFFSKIIELADTVFFILRKKNDQVTFLHVYHHSTMIINWWMAAKYVPVGQSFFVGMINSSIHTLMYMYYFLAALGPDMQKYLWWKKYMTKLQLIQFVAVVSHTGYNKFARTDCDYPWLYNTITFYYTWSMLVFFLNFYYQTYVVCKRQRARAQLLKRQELEQQRKLDGGGDNGPAQGVGGKQNGVGGDVRARHKEGENGDQRKLSQRAYSGRD